MAEVDEVLRRHAPIAADALDQVEAAAWSEGERWGRIELVELISVACAAQLGVPPLTPPERFRGRRRDGGAADGPHPTDRLTGPDRTILDFAVQFSLDVSAVTDEQRSGLFEQLGEQVAGVAAVVFVMDFVPRARAALGALIGGAHGIGPPGTSPAPDEMPIWDALGAFIRAVPQLDALDPITSELVRLRGARQHQCRLCQSLRSRPALLAGADEETFAGADEYERSDLSPLQKAALAFTDAMIWTPGQLESSAVRLVELASEEQRVELVLDVTRNALNKIAVALGADAAHVDEGIEIYDVDADGGLVYGLTLG
jgi:alkylhydroperoxidase family enzyme